MPDELRSRVKPWCSPPSCRTLTGTRTGMRWRERLSVVVFSVICCSVICCGSVPQIGGNVADGTVSRSKKTLLPHVRERSRGGSVRKLESELDSQLNATWAATAEERVADAHVT